MQFGTREELFIPRCLNPGFNQLEVPHCLAKKRGLPRFHLHHRQAHAGGGQHHGNCRRTAAGPYVHQPDWTAWSGIGQVTRGYDGLEQQPIDGGVRIIERGEIDLLIPPGEQFEIGDQPVAQLLRQEQVRLRGPSRETGAEIAGRHP